MLRSKPIKRAFMKQLQEEKLLIDPAHKHAKKALTWYKTLDENEMKQEIDPKWQKNNLEYDLRTCDWIAEKCKCQHYAQNLYAALCNNYFQRNDMWPILKGETWGCSWRHAGGIISDIQQMGDYVDWYCSGIINDLTDEELKKMSSEEVTKFKECRERTKPEGFITDEIRQDLLELGWIVVNEDTD